MSDSTAGSDAAAAAADAAAADAAADDATEQPEEFVNRAARRAKGKKPGAGPEVFSKGQQPVGRGAVQSPRQYGNRRSG
jgi:hypothetical protein